MSAGVEPEGGQLLDGAYDVFQTPLEVLDGPFGSLRRRLLRWRRR